MANSHAAVGWAFSIADLTDITCSAGTCPDNNMLFGGSYNTGPVPGVFNLAFGWSSGNRFAAGDSATFNLTFTNPLSGDPFFANQSYTSVAHVQGISPFGCSGWIVNGSAAAGIPNGTPCSSSPPLVPEPAALGMFGLGTLLMGVFLGLRRRYN